MSLGRQLLFDDGEVFFYLSHQLPRRDLRNPIPLEQCKEERVCVTYARVRHTAVEESIETQGVAERERRPEPRGWRLEQQPDHGLA